MNFCRFSIRATREPYPYSGLDATVVDTPAWAAPSWLAMYTGDPQTGVWRIFLIGVHQHLVGVLLRKLFEALRHLPISMFCTGVRRIQVIDDRRNRRRNGRRINVPHLISYDRWAHPTGFQGRQQIKEKRSPFGRPPSVLLQNCDFLEAARQNAPYFGPQPRPVQAKCEDAGFAVF